MRAPALLLAAVVLGALPAGRAQERVELFADDFSRFPPGHLSAPLGQLNGAIQEHHNDSNYRASVSLPGWAPVQD